MSDHSIFYYPYASFTDEQFPLLKTAALYFDKLYLLDPVGASWDRVGAPDRLREAAKLLADKEILETVSPGDVLKRFDDDITQSIRQDLQSEEFRELCETESQVSGKERWTLALSKVPQDLQADQAKQNLLGDFARSVAEEAARYSEEAHGYDEYSEAGQTFDEFREGYEEDVEYRCADFPLALGESIMMNHALYAGLLHAGATPLTDDRFHHQALANKLERAMQDPVIRERAERRIPERVVKANVLGFRTLTDSQLHLPVLNPEMSLEQVLEFRERHKDALGQARDKLGWMARRIESEPWSDDFFDHLEHHTIPDIADELREARNARDAWLQERWPQGGNVLARAADAVLTVSAGAFTPVAIATGTVDFVSDVAIPGLQWLRNWRQGGETVQENGLTTC